MKFEKERAAALLPPDQSRPPYQGLREPTANDNVLTMNENNGVDCGEAEEG